MTYRKEDLQQIVMESTSFTEVLVKLGRKPVGGSISNLHLRCKRLGIDTSHMIGQAHRRGKGAERQLSIDEIVVMGTPLDHRKATKHLRRALLAIGVEHKCNSCGISEWLGEPLVLEIDHIDGQYWNNQRENLQFLCPNCHSMK